MKTYTEDDILKESDYPDFVDDFSIYGGLKYKLSESEIQWLKFVSDRYSIADYIKSNTDIETGVTTFDMYEFSKALDDDCKGSGKAVCLSDDTALQKIFFYGYIEDMENN